MTVTLLMKIEIGELRRTVDEGRLFYFILFSFPATGLSANVYDSAVMDKVQAQTWRF
jgi:hypothetical protein